VKPEPAAAIRAGIATADTFTRLDNLGFDPDLSLRGYLEALARVRDATRSLVSVSILGKSLAAGSLSPRPGDPQTPAGAGVGGRYRSVFRHSADAAGYADVALSVLRRACAELDGETDRTGHCLRVARDTATAAAEFRTAIARARQDRSGLAVIAGHRQIADSLALCFIRAVSVYGQLADAVSTSGRTLASPGRRRLAGQAADSAGDARPKLRKAGEAASQAQHLLNEYYQHLRKGTGAPCGPCSGTGRAAVITGCLRCLGTGIDPEQNAA
jgi:hypothetical protein